MGAAREQGQPAVIARDRLDDAAAILVGILM